MDKAGFRRAGTGSLGLERIRSASGLLSLEVRRALARDGNLGAMNGLRAFEALGWQEHCNGA